MMNHFLSPKREMVQKNGSNKYQSLGVNSEAPQPRSNNYPRLINFMQGI